MPSLVHFTMFLHDNLLVIFWTHQLLLQELTVNNLGCKDLFRNLNNLCTQFKLKDNQIMALGHSLSENTCETFKCQI